MQKLEALLEGCFFFSSFSSVFLRGFHFVGFKGWFGSHSHGDRVIQKEGMVMMIGTETQRQRFLG